MGIVGVFLSIVRNPWQFLYFHGYRIFNPFYKSVLLPFKTKKIRRKEKINVVFVLYELGSWKTEELYRTMLSHPRFEPQLVLLPNTTAKYAYHIFQKYLEGKDYNYMTLTPKESIITRLHPDIVFYQKPYPGFVASKHDFPNITPFCLQCHVDYCFRNRCLPETSQNKFYHYLWMYFLENKKCVDELVHVFGNSSNNMIPTGLPIMDIMLRDKSTFASPWKSQGGKKRIIYAPHHTISSESYKSTSPIDYSTFLSFADTLLEIVEKYEDKVQWAFKPHPLLKTKLYQIWGKERTDVYYSIWQERMNTQLSEGEYMGLFMHSDAMIHDCGSFKIEYLYTGNPVLYLEKENQVFDYPNWQTQRALELHYKAKTKEEIERFVCDVINNKDELKAERNCFVHDYLTPPYGKKACENIINAILGNEEYSQV